MSREIKFRAWDKDSKRYGEVVEIEYNESREIDGIWVWYNIHERYEPIPGANATVEQYTGLKDKNGKDIYEGDIIQETIIADDTTDGTFQYEVCWDDDMLCWSIKGISDVDYHLHTDLWETNASREVIGNIHENPELLGGGE